MENEDIVTAVRSAKLDTVEQAREEMARIAEYAKALNAKVDAGEKTVNDQKAEVETLAKGLRDAKQVISELRAASEVAARSTDDDVLRSFVDSKTGRVALSQRLGDELPATRSGKAGREVIGGGLLTSRPKNDAHANLIKACEDLYVGTVMAFGTEKALVGDRYDERVVRQTGPLWDRVQRAWGEMPEYLRKAWDGQNGTGGEFIPTPTLSSPFWQVQSYDPDGWLQVIPTIELPSLSAKIPAGTRLPRPYVLKGNSGDNPAMLSRSSVGTDEIDPGLVAMYALSFVYAEAEIGAVIPVIPFVIDAITQSLVVGQRFAQVNGKADGTQDALATWDLRGFFGALDAGPIDYLRAHDGIRAIGLGASNGVDRSTLTLSNLLADFAAITGPKGNVSDNVLGISPEAYLTKIVGMTGIVSVSDYGNRQPIADGEVGTIAGRRIVQTDAFPNDLNASGVYDNSTKTQGCAAVFNRMNFRRPVLVGQSMTLDRQRDITLDGSYVRGKYHTGLTNMTKATDKPVRYLYNL